MTTTILVTVAEMHEQPVELLTVEMTTPGIDLKAGLSVERAFQLLERLHPLIKAKHLQDYEVIELTYFMEGIPRLQESWFSSSTGYPGETIMPIGPGQKLYRLPVIEVELDHMRL